MIEIDNISLDEWYTCVKPYQQTILRQLVSQFGEERAAEEWLTAKGPMQTATFGGSQSNEADTENYWNRLKEELDKFICGHTDYEKEQKKFLAVGKGVGIGAVSGIATWLSPIIGLAQPIILPALILLLHTASKIGVKAYCNK